MKKITLFIMLGLAWCIQAQQTHDITWVMGISNQDASLTINVGDTVRWTWGVAGMPHNVTSVDPNAPTGFGSATMSTLGSTYEFTFTEAVSFTYRCSIHTTMTGTITVEGSSNVDGFTNKSIKFYPTLVDDVLTIEAKETVKEYQIFDIQGKRVLKQTLAGNSSDFNINVTSLTKGVYFVQLTSTEGENITLKFCKK